MPSFSTIDVFTGRAAGITEPPTLNPTKGHREDHGGLRGHSVGDTYPWRVVGLGDGSWEVHGADGQIAARFPPVGARNSDYCCDLAHGYARVMKSHHPTGRIENE